MASTANDRWCDRGRPPSPTADSISFPTLSADEQDKVSYHSGWAIKRVREKLIVSRKSYSALDSEGKEQVCSRAELLALLEKLGKDVLDADKRRHYFQPSADVASLFQYLHGIAQGLLSDKVSAAKEKKCVDSVLFFFFFLHLIRAFLTGIFYK